MRTMFGMLSAGLTIAIMTAPDAAQNLFAPPIPPEPIPATAEEMLETAHILRRPPGVPVVITVSPRGDDAGDGSATRPFATLSRAQVEVRLHNRSSDVTVRLADGTYRLSAPLQFSAADGGQNGHVVRWEAAPNARPVISGGTVVTGWRLADAQRGIWVASVPIGSDPRQIWVEGRMAKRATVEASRRAFAFHDWGIEIVDPAWRFLADLPDQGRMEVEGTSWFTHRHAVVDRVDGNRILMKQPGWQNNIIGYDTIAQPLAGEKARLFLVNALAFLKKGGEFYVDPAKGQLYYKPRDSEDMGRAEVVMPRLQSLVAIGGTYDVPVRDLAFVGLGFQHTSWLAPSSPDGYASQQSGAFLSGRLADYPDHPIRDCSWGCRAFETTRNRWHQQPAAIQVAAATRIRFERDDFTHLGQIALGIGNNADANDRGIGMGATAITVERNRFFDLAGGAIMVGGITPDAHHPVVPEAGVRDILIRNNVVKRVSQDYHEQAGILVTYATGAVITHNDVSDAPYDGIDVGWGWGTNDPGGSPAYRVASRGYYDFPGNRVYDTPTILRDTVITANRVHNVKSWFPDGGAIYHLSADPGALIAENYIYDVPGGIALYLDEGSRYVMVRNNVVSNVGVWLHLNSQGDMLPRRTAMDNTARNNWYDSGKQNGEWTDYLNNRTVDNVLVKNGEWPAAARAVIDRAGVEPEK
ncbi:right-handed parallel beta-helix repeat-containing protein [Sphingomonas sp. SAFR-052]|uniref:right-handed parallel beta-helix repeat-containing protein n=1 Tax=Sphingomonas sp. SAFR-052 TaxID=3436867 RepID=UPI003F7FAAFF